ncbi:uncharacterized protein LOC126273493 [Schistocerca gregaria]|uniref:uncharacterized protein LOC126273493 n=1 Tax=Schistocerca gregaria TaxID=7010 RepID=UPI00211EE30C|nr:uncharacterized protein LOC126273493 [Schistocerca gregaria]
MPELTASNPEEGKLLHAESSVPAAPASAQVQQPVAGEVPEQTYKTAELLKRWPAIVIAFQKSRDAYCSVKQKARIITCSLNLAEKVVGSVFKFAESKVSSLVPVIQNIDKAVSEGVVVIEKKFPAVRESPEKLYSAITQQIIKIIRPALDKTEAISEIGRKKLNRAGKIIMKKYNNVITIVDSWIDKLEKKLNVAAPGVQTATAEASSVLVAPDETTIPTAGPALEPPAGRVRQALTLCRRAATALAVFQVGAAFYLLPRAPLVGRFFREMEAPASSSSSGASFARLPTPTPSEERPLSRPLSMHSLHPEQFISLPQE